MKYKYDVFISYSRRDYVDESYNVIPGNAIAEIQNVFDENGITYWFDKDGIYSGQEFIEIITGAIAESKILIFISSKHSNESMWTAGEIFEALDGEKAIIPVKIDNSQYNKKFKLLIRPLDYIDYQENPQNALKDLLRAINKVKEDIAQKQREEEKLRQEKEAEAKKEKIKEEISILAKDCQRLTLQQIDVVNQIFEKQIYIGNTTKICPICDKEVSISSNFCSRCGWTFPILYYIDGNDTYQLDEKQLSVARTNWRSINMVSELQTIKSNLEIENQRLQRSLLQATEDCNSMNENLKKNESAIQKAKIEIKQMQILNKESDSRIKELEFSIIESTRENEKIKKEEQRNNEKIALVLKVENSKKQSFTFLNKTQLIQQDKRGDLVEYLAENEEYGKTQIGMDFKYVDLQAEVRITDIIEKNAQEQKQFKYDIYQKPGEMVKLELAPKKIDNTYLTICYQINITNLGNEIGILENIIDVLPEGTNFQIAQNEGWILNREGNAQYDAQKLEILPRETKRIEITLNWEATEENLAQKTNKIAIQASNDLDEILLQEEKIQLEKTNNYASSSMLVSVITGRTIVLWTILTICVLGILVTGILIIKKYVIK